MAIFFEGIYKFDEIFQFVLDHLDLLLNMLEHIINILFEI
jgi:hypothetical protein